MGLLWQAARGSFSASRAAGNAAERNLAGWSANRGRRALRSGLFGPWDPPPPPGAAGFLDFSGVARPDDINCENWWFPLGRYVKPKNPWRPTDEIGLPLPEANRHTVVLGPTRAGKTAGIVAPWIVSALRAGFLVAALDVKGGGDLLNEVVAYRDAVAPGEQMRVTKWNYKDPADSKRWNFIRELDSEGAVDAAAEAICGRARDNDPNKNFHLRDLKWVRGLLELAYLSGLTLTVRDLLQILADQDALRRVAARHSGSRGASRVADLCGFSSDEFLKATQFIATYFETLNTDGFVEVTSTPQIDVRRTAFGKSGLVLVNAPISDGNLSEAASGLFLSQLLHRRFSAFGSSAIPMLLVLDEAPRLQDRMDLGRLLSLAAGADISVLLAAQDVEQFHETKRSEILANCGTVILLGGAAPTTTEHVGKRLGTRVRSTISSADSYDRRSGHSTSYNRGSETVPVLGHTELSNPPSGMRGAVVANSRLSQRPILVDLTRPDLVGH